MSDEKVEFRSFEHVVRVVNYQVRLRGIDGGSPENRRWWSQPIVEDDAGRAHLAEMIGRLLAADPSQIIGTALGHGLEEYAEKLGKPYVRGVPPRHPDQDRHDAMLRARGG